MDINPDDFIVVPNWKRFQHYKDRNPPWIKVYTELLHDPDYLGLSLASKGLLLQIWLVYSQTNGRLTADTLRRVCRAGWGYPQLVSLNDAGFIKVSASAALAPKTEAEIEQRDSLPRVPLPSSEDEKKEELLRRALDYAADWKGGASDDFENALDGLERELRVRLSQTERSKLWDEALRRDRKTKA